MNPPPKTQKVGRYTVAGGLVAFGAALLVDNLTGGSVGLRLVSKLWPLLLIGFGLEYLVRSLMSQRSGQEVRLRFDFGGTILLAILISLSLGFTSLRSLINPDGFSFRIAPLESQTATYTFPTTGVKELVLNVPVGSITLATGNPGEDLRVDATYSAQSIFSSGDIRSQLENVELTGTPGEVLTLKTEAPGSLNDFSVNYVISAPPGLKVKATTDTGRIEVTGYTGDLNLENQTGRITVDSGSGSLAARGNNTHMQVVAFVGPITAETNVGSLEIRDVTGALQLETRTGSINLQEFRGGKVVALARTGSVRASTNSPLEGDLSLTSRTGSVNLRLPLASSMQLTAKTNTGSLMVPTFATVTKRGTTKTATGTTGDGKFTVNLETGTGSIDFVTQ